VDTAGFAAAWLRSIGARDPAVHGPRPAPPGPVPDDWLGPPPQAGLLPTAPPTASPPPVAPGAPEPPGDAGEVIIVVVLVVGLLGAAAVAALVALRRRRTP
jgi:hypothetical protein